MIPAALLAQTTPPDFSGVYYPINPFGGAALGRGPAAGKAPPAAGKQKGPPPRPTQSAPVSDGSQGRSADAPSLTPEYMAKWEVIRKSRMAGSSEYDNTAKCLPPGMPAMMSMAYGMEVMQNKDKITFFSELNDALRRVYLDGRKPTQKILDDPTYAGYSTGRWDGDTLVVDTVGFNDKFWFDMAGHPHTTGLHVVERYHRRDFGNLDIGITIEDPGTYTKPWTIQRISTLETGIEMSEYICNENNSDVLHLVGK
jgi:hypothetical protein